jgi:hypothetical protein
MRPEVAGLAAPFVHVDRSAKLVGVDPKKRATLERPSSAMVPRADLDPSRSVAAQTMHDLRNAVGVIRLCAANLRNARARDVSSAADLEDIDIATARALELVARLDAMTKKSDSE